MLKEFCTEFGCGGKLERKDGAEHLLNEGGVQVLLVGITVWTCSKCGAVLPEIPYLEELHKAVASAIVNRPGHLTGPEVRFLRKRMGRNITDLAKQLGVTREWLSSCESGRRKPGTTLDALLRVIYLRHFRDLSERRLDLALEASRKETPPPTPYRVPVQLLEVGQTYELKVVP